jgi:hypothetical protein
MFKCTEEHDLKKIETLFKVAAQIQANVEEQEDKIETHKDGNFPHEE